eukprot:4237833-Amphidinium_carterae.1
MNSYPHFIVCTSLPSRLPAASSIAYFAIDCRLLHTSGKVSQNTHHEYESAVLARHKYNNRMKVCSFTTNDPLSQATFRVTHRSA